MISKKQKWHKVNCRVEWNIWDSVGNVSRKIEENCIVEYNGKITYKITLLDGTIFRKRHKTKGFFIFDVNGKLLNT